MADPTASGEKDPYISHLKSKNNYESWMEYLRETTRPRVGIIHILDITASGDIHRWDIDNTLNPSTKLTERQLDNETRLVVFNPRIQARVQNHAGVLYDVDPGFFRAVKKNSIFGKYSRFHHRVPEFLIGNQPQHLDLGYGWTGVIYCRDNFNIVIVSAADLPGGVHNVHEEYIDLNDIYPNTVTSSEGYLQALLRYDRKFFAEAHKDPLFLLLPVLDIHAIYLYEGLIAEDRCFRLRNTGREVERNERDPIERAWDALRMMKHDGMGPLDCIEQYNNGHIGNQARSSQDYKNLVKRLRCIEEQISRTEALARDYLQHRVGMSSLEASRLSIKQARLALEESRRTKLITVLAIFFVPISLSTSVFGMNIHELNENGQSLWVFILTTVLIVAATMTAWGFMYQFQKYNSLPKIYDNEEKSWRARFYQLIRLVLYGHIIWTWKSGILVSLLTDGRVAFIRSCTEHKPTAGYGLLSHSEHGPCNYIKEHLGSGKGFRCSMLKDQIDG
ncbi:hypothetical protein F5Y10DRAFT_277093 [Nemania abortiva]|nr:hypothetical protein F5Y10DRAFT_277093 [Nemania abortiva]